MSLVWFRTVSFLVMSHVSMLLLGLLVVWAWLRWRGERRWGWALAIGVFSGWAAITRPVDALAYAIPVGLAMAANLTQTLKALQRRIVAAILGVGLLVVAAVLYALEAGGPSLVGVPLSAWVAGIGGIWAILAALPRRR